jgi:2-furoyl-CoA dehydrogenase FAD binding subunit
MKPAPFEYCRPESLTEVLSLLGEHGDEAALLAGGLSLGPLLNMRLARPTLVIDLNRLDELATIELADGYLRTAALVRQADVEASAEARQELPLLVAALAHVGHYQTRSRGTLAGSVAMADPSAEIPLCLATLGGEVELSSSRGVRRVAADDFFQGALTTARAEDEMITALFWPVAGDETGTTFEEISERRGDFAIVAAAAWVERLPDGGLRYRLGLGGVEERPHCHQGEVAVPEDFDGLAAELVRGISPLGDQRASADYRRHLAGVLARRALQTAFERATERRP